MVRDCESYTVDCCIILVPDAVKAIKILTTCPRTIKIGCSLVACYCPIPRLFPFLLRYSLPRIEKRKAANLLPIHGAHGWAGVH